MSADIAANEIDKLRNEIARLKGQTNWVCKCGGTDCEGQKENEKLQSELNYRRRVMEFQEYQGFILVNLMTKAQLDAYDEVAEMAPRGTSYKDINDTIKQVRKERGI